ncbi:hypothetical protein ACRWQL_00490 (plasmid) [Shewanella sp. HL-SH4]|uniref:hypothetical protein n=1 Tax=Shewanella sp. HL-SH4 TaxID=3436240 RepID=UPI003EBE24F3
MSKLLTELIAAYTSDVPDAAETVLKGRTHCELVNLRFVFCILTELSFWGFLHIRSG